ncbi:MAG: hypothetical protein ACMG6S_15075 [Byssovorax sp.]
MKLLTPQAPSTVYVIFPASERASWRRSSISPSSDWALRLIFSCASFCFSVTGP